MKIKKIKFTRKFVLGMAVIVSLTVTGCGKQTPQTETSQSIEANLAEDYYDEMHEKQIKMIEITGQFSDLLGHPERGSDLWGDSMVSTLTSMENTSKEIIQMHAPKEARKYHKLMVEAAEYNIEFVSTFIRGYDEDNVELLQRATELMVLSREKTKEATEVLRRND